MLRFPNLTRRDKKAGYKGVYNSRDKFTAHVHQSGRRFHLGTFLDEHQAALAVNEALVLLYPDLPIRFLNRLLPENVPSPEDQDSIRKEVFVRLAAKP